MTYSNCGILEIAQGEDFMLKVGGAILARHKGMGENPWSIVALVETLPFLNANQQDGTDIRVWPKTIAITAMQTLFRHKNKQK